VLHPRFTAGSRPCSAQIGFLAPPYLRVYGFGMLFQTPYLIQGLFEKAHFTVDPVLHRIGYSPLGIVYLKTAKNKSLRLTPEALKVKISKKYKNQRSKT
jgi:hypothetical protein